jgi:hypothetical protein
MSADARMLGKDRLARAVLALQCIGLLSLPKFGLGEATPWLARMGVIGALPAGPFDPRAVEYFFYRACVLMAPYFDVSVQAMRVRLEQLGLLLVDSPRQPSLAL